MTHSIMAQSAAPGSVQAAGWFQGRSFDDWREEFDSRGLVIFERVLSAEKVAPFPPTSPKPCPSVRAS